LSRVLFLTPQLPFPPHQGAAIRNLNLIKIAAQRHEVAVYSFVRSPEENAGIGPLREWASEVRTFDAPRRTLAERALLTAFAGTPDMARRLHSGEFAQAVAEARADVVQAEGIEMAQYLDHATGWTVLDCHNAEWMLQRRTCTLDLGRGRAVGAAYSLAQWLKLRAYERRACQRSDALIAVSDEDRQALLDLDPNLQIEVLPNGIDASTFTPSEFPPKPNTFLFTGTLDFRPNIDAVLWLADEVWPLIRRRLPCAELTLAGRAPAPVIRRLDGRNGIRVAASPLDMRPHFAESCVYLAPIRAGGGSRFKLLEAMSCGLGIVSTTFGAEGLAVQDGVQLRLADTPGQLAEAALELAGDQAQRERLGAAARRLVLDRYDWPVLAPTLHRVYDTLLAPPSEPVSVVVTVLNEAQAVGPLLDDLLAQDRRPDEIVVVDGGSHDGTPDVVRRYGEPVRLIEAPGANISQGRNRGLSETRHDIVAVADAGVRLKPDWLRRITQPLQAGRAELVAGFFEPDPRTPFETAMGATVLPTLDDVDARKFLPSSRSLALRKDAWRRAGGYPEWLDYCEDLVFDLTIRADRSLRVAFAPRAAARFRPRSSLRTFFRQYYRYARGDGKADLWRGRHALRYAAYAHLLATIACLLSPSARLRRKAVVYFTSSTLLGGAAYLRRPVQRVLRLGRGASAGEWACMLALVPVIRLVGDVAKMLGYPAGWWWRRRNNPPEWRR
jgi:glycosyltransferase involved in cell wall biosynthesis